jgi:hypothetical protein
MIRVLSLLKKFALYSVLLFCQMEFLVFAVLILFLVEYEMKTQNHSLTTAALT